MAAAPCALLLVMTITGADCNTDRTVGAHGVRHGQETTYRAQVEGLATRSRVHGAAWRATLEDRLLHAGTRPQGWKGTEK